MHSRFALPLTPRERRGDAHPLNRAHRIVLLFAAIACGLIVNNATQPLLGQTAQALAVVSAASYEPVISPNSLASVFGTGLASELAVATFDESGKLPTELGGVQVTINGQPAELIFVSPEQINFLVGSGVEIGVAQIAVSLPGAPAGPAASSTMEVAVQTVAPGIFNVACLRPDRGAVLNGVTYRLEPFRAITAENHIDDKRTRLAIFGTGIRFAGGGGVPENPNVAAHVAVEAIDLANRTFELAVEYAGPAPDFAGLDQINAVLAPEMDGIGVLRLRIRIGEVYSNFVTVQVSPASLRHDATPGSYFISTIAGVGSPGLSGDMGPALEAMLHTPSGTALDASGNLYIADADNHVVRRVGQDGIITTFAGTGESGSSGDGGPAAQARMKRPVAVAADRLGNIYIADAEDHRVRKVDSNGVITAFAGVGVSGFGGDGAPATSAQLNTPSAVAANAFGSVFIADTGNHRIRLVTGDGLIQTYAGSGEPGFFGDGGLSVLARLTAPSSVATSPNHSVYVADAGNYVIRRLDIGGGIQSIAGCNQEGDSGDTGDAAEAKFGAPLHLALDPEWRMFVSDAQHDRVRLIDSNCVIHAAAGNGQAGFSGDGGPAVDAMLNDPLGMATNPFGDVYVADSSNQRIRLLWRDFGDGSGGTGDPGDPSTECGIISSLVVSPAVVIGGQSTTGHVRLNCPADEDIILILASSDTAVMVPSSITIHAGQLTASFPIQTSPVDEVTPVLITGDDGEGHQVSAPLTLVPGGEPTIQSLSINTDSVTGGFPATGLVTIGAPAPQGGTVVALSSDKTQATVAASVTIPEGQTTAEFLIFTTEVQAAVLAAITGETDGLTASDTLLILPTDGDGGTILSFTISPGAVAGGESATGTLTLTEAAGAGGVEVLLNSNRSAVIVPESVTIPEGDASLSFQIATTEVDSTVTATVTAAAGNVVTATLQVNPEGGTGPDPSRVPLASLSLDPSTVVGGNSSTGTVTLTSPAPAGGALVELSSNSGSASVPGSIVIPEGVASGQFTVATLPVGGQTIATIAATSANSVNADLTINPKGAGGPGEGEILSLTVSPSTVVGGNPSTGIVTLAGAAPENGILVNLSSNKGSATLPSSIVIPSGATTGEFTISTTPVQSQVSALITATSANSVSATLTIDPSGPDGPGEGQILSLTLDPTSVTGGSPSTGTVTLAAVSPEGGILVSLSSNNGSASVPGSIVVPAGSTSGQFTVNTNAVNSQTMATITATSANSVNAALTINPASPGEGQILSLTLNPSTVTGGNPSTGTVTLAAAASAGGVLVNLSSNNGSATVPESIVIPAGSSSGQFTVSTSPVGSETVATITAASANSVNAALTIQPASPGQGQILSLTLDPSTVTGGDPSTGTVTLAAQAGAGGVLVNLSSNSGSASVPGSIVIPEGSNSGQFTVTTSVVNSQTMATITAASSNSVNAALTINPAGPGSGQILSLTLSPTTVTGGNPSTGTVTLAAVAPAGGILVNLSSNKASATVPASIVIPEGSSSGQFTVSTTPVGNATIASITATSANSVNAALTINPADPGPGQLASLSLSPSTVTGGSPSTGTVTLTSAAPAGGVLVNLSSNKGSATVPASIVIPEGESSGQFTVNTTAVASQTLATITATSANSVNAVLTINPPGPGNGQIASLSLNPTTVAGGNPSTGTVTLSAPAPAGGILVNLSSGNGAATVPESIVIPQGSNSGQFTVSTTVVASQTMATITATSANSVNAALTINPASPGQGQISGLTLNPTTVTGGNPSTGTVTLSAPAPAGGILVNLSSSNGSATVPESIVIPQGSNSGQFTVSTTVVASQTVATITATSANSVNAALTINPASPGQGQIASLTLDPTAVEGGNSSTGTVTLTAPAPAAGILVNLSSNNGAATVPGSIVIPQGATSGQFTVNTTPVANQTAATITAASSNSMNATLTINPPPPPPCVASIELSVGSITGGLPVSATVFLTAPAPSGGLQVSLSSSSIFASVPSSVTVAAGQTSASFNITTSVVALLTNVTIQATAAGCSGVSANLTLQVGGPGQGQISSLILNPSTVTGGSPSTGTVTLASPAPAGGIEVNLSSNNGAASVPGSIVIPEGSNSGQFTVTTSTVGVQTTATITASSSNSVNAALTINPPSPGQGQISSLTLNPSTVTGGSPSTGTVTLAAPAPAGGIQVNLSSNNGSASVPGSIVIPQGSNSGQFSVTTSTVASQTTATITASSSNSVNASLTINPPGPGNGQIASLVLNPSTLQGGNSSTGTVTLTSNAPAGGVLVNLSSNKAAASVTSSIVIPQGSNSGQFTVTTTAVASQTIAAITASSSNTVNANLTINPVPPPCVSSIELSADVALGGTSVTGTVFLTSPAPFGGITVSLLSSSPLATVGASVTIPEGQISASFTISTNPVAALTVVQIQALIPTCTTITATLTINAPILQSLGISPSSIGLLGSATGTVTLNGPAPAGGLTINLSGSSHNITQGLLSGVLSILTPSSVTVSAGATTANFNVNATLTVLLSLLNDVTGSVTADLNGVLKSANITIRGVL